GLRPIARLAWCPTLFVAPRHTFEPTLTSRELASGQVLIPPKPAWHPPGSPGSPGRGDSGRVGAHIPGLARPLVSTGHFRRTCSKAARPEDGTASGASWVAAVA